MTTVEKNVSLHEIDEESRNMAEQPMFNLLEGEEDESRRELYAKHFSFGSGQRQAIMFGNPVHYRDDDGKMREIDNTMCLATISGQQVYRNADNPMQVEFPANADNNALVKLINDGHELAWCFEQPVQAVAAQVANGETLLRRELIDKAAAMKADMPRLVQMMDLTDANVMSTAALVEAVTPAGLDKDAFKAVMTSEDILTIDTSTLDKALRLPVERRMSRIEKQAELRYDQLLPGISARYILTDAGVKEDIIVERESALNSVALRLPDHYRYTVEDDQSVQIEANGEMVFTFAPPRVYDANGSEEIATVSLESCDGYVRMAYVLSEDFLSNAVYPVTIDPVVKTKRTESNIIDTYLRSTSPSTKFGSSSKLVCGKGGDSGAVYVTLIRFKQLVKQSASDTIISAYLRLYTDTYQSGTSLFGAYEILKDWNENATWNNFGPTTAGNISTKLLSYITHTDYSDHITWFDLTNLYKSWYHQSTSRGVALKRTIGNSSQDYTEWCSSDASGRSGSYPCMVVNYISHAGLEDWWQYETMSAGRAGTAHVDIYNGNLVFDHPDISVSGSRMPVSVTHYYNSCLASDNTYKCGNGWRTSMQQSLHVEVLNNTTYYVWTDGDGTEHYFKKNGSTYEDQEGMKLKLTFPDSSTARITSKDHTAMDFAKPATPNSGSVGTKKYLKYIRDALNVADSSKGSFITLTTLSGAFTDSRISAITDGAGRVTTYTYDADGNYLQRITAPDGTYVSFDYDGNLLKRIHYSDITDTDKYTEYSYVGNLLVSAKNYDGIQINVGFAAAEYTNHANVEDPENFDELSRRVCSLETVNGSVEGAKQLFDYENLTTKITSVKDSDSGNDKTITYQFNDAGNVTCMFDELGYAQATTYSSTIPNTEEQSSKLQRAVMNYCPNIDFSSEWTSENAADGAFAEADGNNRCLGMPSAKVTGSMVYSCTVPVLAKRNDGNTDDQTYTFSAYIRRRGVITGNAFIRMAVNGTPYDSRVVRDSTDNTSGGPGADGWERVFVTASVPENAVVALKLVFDGPKGSAWFACPQLETGRIPNRVNLLVNGDFSHTRVNSATDTRIFPEKWNAGTGITSSALNCVVTEDHGIPENLTGNALRMTSKPDASNVAFSQSVNIRGVKGDCLVIGGWLNAESVAKVLSESSRKCAPCICYRFANGSTNGDWKYAEFSRAWIGWQFGCWAVVATGDFTRFDYTINYSRNAQTAMFTNMFLYREQFGQSFAYDNDKNVISVANLANTQSDIKYDDAHNIRSYVQPGAGADDKYTFVYGANEAAQKKHLLQSSATPMAIEQKFEYDDYGNQTTAKTFKAPVAKDGAQWICHKEIINGELQDVKEDQTANEKVIGAKTEYTGHVIPEGVSDHLTGNYVHRSIDARGNAVTKVMGASIEGTPDHEKYLLKQVIDPLNQTVNYNYDTAKRVADVYSTDTVANKTYRNHYTYKNDRIKTVSHNTDDDDTCNVVYTFDYDALGRKRDVSVGNGGQNSTPVLLSHNVYTDDRSGLLKEVHYGGEIEEQELITGVCGRVIYEYDDFDRMKSVSYADDENEASEELCYTYEYGANGQVSFMEDHKLGQTKQVEYDLAERPCQSTIRDDEGNLLYRTTLKYDKLNRLEKFGEQTDRSSHRTTYSYDKDNRTTKMAYDGAAHQVEYKYDSMGRITDRLLRNGNAEYDTHYDYLAADAEGIRIYGDGATTPLVSGITRGSGENAMNYGYLYDERGNITSETLTRGTGANAPTRTVHYTYDAIGQLKAVNDPDDKGVGQYGTVWEYDYDRGGNITRMSRYVRNQNGSRGSLVDYADYSYENTVWKDMLTKVEKKNAQDQVLEVKDYDYNAIGNMTRDGEWTYEWQAGRQLKRMWKPMSDEECKTCEVGSDGGDISLEITFSGSNVFENGVTSVTLSAKLKVGDHEFTNDELSSIGVAFTWIDGDNAILGRGKDLVIQRTSLSADKKIQCTVAKVNDYGSFSLIEDNGVLKLQHTTGSSNPLHRLYITPIKDAQGNVIDSSVGVLKADDQGASIYSFDNPLLKVDSDKIACTITASAMVYLTRPEREVRYFYNADGLRTRKEEWVNDDLAEATDYILHGKLVTEMRRGSDVLHFFYDAQSRPAMVKWNGQMYTYVHNLQGDIVAIIDSSGDKVVEYRYDAWGRDIGRTLTTELGELNPFRYRGYVYDEETGLYYLRSRYYNAGIGRFVNCDEMISGSMLENNVFSYAKNAPLLNCDQQGTSSYSIVLNVYYPEHYNNTEGHYDISIISKDTGMETILSYGADDNGNGVVRTYDYGHPGAIVPDEEYLVFDDVSEDDLENFYRNFYSEYAPFSGQPGDKGASYIDRVIYKGSEIYNKGDKSRLPLSYCGDNAILILRGMEKAFKQSPCLIKNSNKNDLHGLYKWFHKVPRKLTPKGRDQIIKKLGSFFRKYERG